MEAQGYWLRNNYILEMDKYHVQYIIDCPTAFGMTEEIVIEKFKKFNKNIVLSKDAIPENILFNFFHSKVFNTCNGIQLNSGLIIGYAGSLKQLFKLTLNL